MNICRRMKERKMKKNIIFAITIIAALILGGCNLLIGPDTPENEGQLLISIGETGNSRAISSGRDLPGELLEALRYEVVLTGPVGETLTETLPHGGSLSLLVGLGEWRIAVNAYYLGNVLAGTGNTSVRVMPGSNSAQIALDINGGYFGISIDPAVTNGTVSSDFGAAFPGTTVTLTVTPDDGYKLKDGSLAANSGGVSFAGSGPEYTFTMPARDIAIMAVFVREAGFTIEGPQEGSVNVTAVHSAGRLPPTDLSYSDRESVTFTVDGDYTQEAGTLKWYVNGEEKTGTGNSLTINAVDYIKRDYSLTVLIKEDDLWYSAGASFKVID
jgi:hypothetical protein